MPKSASPVPPSTCSGRWRNRVRKRTVSKSRNPFIKPREPILGNPVTPAAMPNLDLGNAKSAGVGQHRDETVQLAVDADLAKTSLR